MAETTAPLPDLPSSAAATIAAICPYLLADEGAWRSVGPAREHRCTAVTPAAILAPDKQRRLCLTAEHTGCATYLVATGQGETTSSATVPRIERVPRSSGRDIVRTVPVVLDHGRLSVGLPGLTLEGHLGQLALIALMAVAFIAILIARVPGDGGGGLGAGAIVDATPTPHAVAAESTEPEPEPTAEPKPVRTLVPTEVEPSAEPTEEATPKPTKEPTAKPKKKPTTYKVKRGDTLSGIAAEFGTTVKVLARLNDIDDPRTLRVGQVLELP